MDAAARRLLAADIDAAARLTGDFVLRSGARATEYLDKYRFEADPHLLRRVAEAMLPLVPAETEVLAGVELGGVPIATAMSLLSGRPAAFVRKELAGLPLPEGTDADLGKGKEVYAQTCAVCHGQGGEGMAALGAPNLQHASGWIYGSSLGQLQQTIRHGRNGQMPAQQQYLGNDKVHLLAAYVYSLSKNPEQVAKQ